MAEYRAYLDELREIYPETPTVDEALGSLLAESSAK